MCVCVCLGGQGLQRERESRLNTSLNKAALTSFWGDFLVAALLSSSPLDGSKCLVEALHKAKNKKLKRRDKNSCIHTNIHPHAHINSNILRKGKQRGKTHPF